MTISNLSDASWQPPSNFISVESALEGVTVFAPQKVEQIKTEKVMTYKCPQCGASTRFDVSHGGVACEHCGYVSQIATEQVGTRAGELEFTLETLSEAEQGWGQDRKELHCESCGAMITLAQGALTTTCPFCASHQVNVRPAPSDTLRPKFLIPFKIPVETNRARAEGWLGKGWFHPDELSKSAIIDRFIGIYLPYWTFDAAILAKWNAEVGYERQERYYDSGSKEWKTRTVIDWRWENGQVNLIIDDMIVPGSSHISKLIFERILPYNLNELVAYEADFLAGWQASTFDIPLPQAWETGKTRMREKAKDACYADISSSHVRNFSMNADFGDESWRYILLPTYLAAYKFEEKIFQVLVNGQTGTISGQKPVAWWKIWLAIGALLSPGILLGLIGLPLLLAGGVGILPIIIGFILLMIGGTISVSIYRKAVASEAY